MSEQWIPYEKIDWSSSSLYPRAPRPWRFIDNADPREYLYHPELEKWVHQSNISKVVPNQIQPKG